MSINTGLPPARTFSGLFIFLVPSLLIPAFFLLFRKARPEPNPYIYEKLGMKGKSNLADEHDPQYKGPARASNTNDWRLKAILCHPIKSCKGFELDSAIIDGSGILWDRRFAFAEWTELKSQPGQPKTIGWKFRTLRQPGYNKLALVKPEVWLKKGSDTEGLLIVRYPSTPTGALAPLYNILMALGLVPKETSFEVPLHPPENHDYPKEQMELFGDRPIWLNYQRHVPRSLQMLVGAPNPVTLFRVDPAAYREVHGNAPKADDVGYQPVVAAADSYPLSIQNLASVREIADKVKEAIPQFTIRRLRPNLIVTGGPKFDEDDWKHIMIGEHDIYSSCRTTRCKLPCVDPDTAERHESQPETVRQRLVLYLYTANVCVQYLRKNRNIDEGVPFSGCLGMQLVPATNDLFEVKVGDRIKILERGEHVFIK